MSVTVATVLESGSLSWYHGGSYVLSWYHGVSYVLAESVSTDSCYSPTRLGSETESDNESLISSAPNTGLKNTAQKIYFWVEKVLDIQFYMNQIMVKLEYS